MSTVYYTEVNGVITYYHNLDDARAELINAGYQLDRDIDIQHNDAAIYVRTDNNNLLCADNQSAYIRWIIVH